MEAHRLVLNDPLVQLEAALLQPLFGARVAGIQDRQTVLLRHGVDGGEEGREILLGVDVLLAMGGEQDILPFFQTQPFVNVGRFDLGEVLVQHLRHG